jgi:2-keto-3-deoxy-L-fuconate dehydrogenase
MARNLEGRTIFITGAASGIGAACARRCAERGAESLILLDRDMLGLQALELPCPTKILHGDVSDPALWGYICSSLEGIDGAVIAAGVAHGSSIADTDFADWRKVMSVNLDGAFLALRGSLRAMKPKGYGSVVTVASAKKTSPPMRPARQG